MPSSLHPAKTYTLPLLDPLLQKTMQKDKRYLETTRIPIITVSASYVEDLKGLHHLPEKDIAQDVVLSRAHYSMALAVAVQAWQKKIDPSQAWIVDPTNYVTAKDWSRVIFTETVGKVLARVSPLKKMKDLVDRFGRNQLPILSSISAPLLYLTQDIVRPILSMHIASGNILAAQGKTVVQMITDPHVRADYLNEAERKNMFFLVFDQQTKTDFIEKAELLNKKVDQNRVIVTGPPVDPRVVQNVQFKQVWQDSTDHPKPLRLCFTTGGLGTNKNEIKELLKQLLPKLNKTPQSYQLLIYAGTHLDFVKMVRQLTDKHNLALNQITCHDPASFGIRAKLVTPAIIQKFKKSLEKAPVSIIYHPQVVDANELLTHLAFPWADGFISKPSGDMAYDAVMSGSFLLTLQEWGEWEHNIRQLFTNLGVAKQAETDDIVEQLEQLKKTNSSGKSWITQAMSQTKQLEPLFYQGTKNIVENIEKIGLLNQPKQLK
ncbi:MAG TPA: hypothetical protein PLM16_00670 [Candidatus Woesebacteria bacterium]|nr:hypothetical protein [Candidatus Woesebacteria bacterium]